MNTCRLLEGEEWIFYQAAGLRMWSPKQQNLITQKLVRTANVETLQTHRIKVRMLEPRNYFNKSSGWC